MTRATCRLCASPDLTLHFEVRGQVLDRCGACGFVQVRERPTAEALRELYGDGYFGQGKYEDAFAQRKEGERRLALLERSGVPAGGRVLDAGCATGDFLRLASPRYAMWGLDVSAYATDVARRMSPELADRIFTGFVEEQAFAPQSFDAVVLWDVVEHIWDPRAVLERLVDLLKPGGVLVLSTPDIGAPTARLMRRRWAFMTPPEHLGFFNRASLTRLLEGDLGLETIASTASGKWANLGFLVYKLGRVFPGVVPRGLAARVQKSPLGGAALYVPTGDVRYVAARKRAA